MFSAHNCTPSMAASAASALGLPACRQTRTNGNANLLLSCIQVGRAVLMPRCYSQVRPGALEGYPRSVEQLCWRISKTAWRPPYTLGATKPMTPEETKHIAAVRKAALFLPVRCCLAIFSTLNSPRSFVTCSSPAKALEQMTAIACAPEL